MFMKNEDNFSSSEYYLAVSLLALGEELVDVEKARNSSRAIFVFKKSSTLAKNVDDFRQGKLLVEPQKLFIQHKILKSRLYNVY